VERPDGQLAMTLKKWRLIGEPRFRSLFRTLLPDTAREYIHRTIISRINADRKPRRASRTQRQAEAITLQQQLFGGYPDLAERALENLNTPQTPVRERSRACWALARWNAYQGRSERALEYLSVLRTLSPRHTNSPKPGLLEADLLRKAGKVKEALLRLNELRDEWGDRPDLILGMANVASAAAPPHLAEGTRLTWLNRLFETSGLAMLEKTDSASPLSLSNLGAPSARAAINDNQAKLSVLVPAHNCSETLPVALSCILNQTWRNLEVIVVDDGSADDTFDVIEEFRRQDSRVVGVRHTSNLGAYCARNTALDQATGDLVTVHDADDWSHPQKFEAQINALSTRSIFNTSCAIRVSRALDVDIGAGTVPYRRKCLFDDGAEERLSRDWGGTEVRYQPQNLLHANTFPTEFILRCRFHSC
jgi:hypothetical protein